MKNSTTTPRAAKGDHVDLNDLGFGSRLTGQRLLNRDGSFNVKQEGFSILRSSSLYPGVCLGDQHHVCTVHARSSYKGDEVVWGARFSDMYRRGDDGMISVDVKRLHSIEPFPRS